MRLIAGQMTYVNEASRSQAAISFRRGFSKAEPRTQFAALCYRYDKQDRIRVLLITGRRTGRWKLPQGWPEEGLTPAETAMKEAYEEAGVRGSCHDECIGHFVYSKSLRRKVTLPCIVAVFPIRINGIAKTYPETGERKLVWLSPKKAAKKVAEPSLKLILKRFDPSHLRP